MFLLAIGGAKTVLSICRAETLNCGSNFTNCQDYDGVIRILKMSLCLILNTIKECTEKSNGDIYLFLPSVVPFVGLTSHHPHLPPPPKYKLQD